MAGEKSCRTCEFLYYEELWDNTILSCVYVDGAPENLPGVTPYSLRDRVCGHWALNPDVPKRHYASNRYGWEQQDG